MAEVELSCELRVENLYTSAVSLALRVTIGKSHAVLDDSPLPYATRIPDTTIEDKYNL
jgi:hypothetical protein